jgi:DtxR family Mn-dependent transcriptional regulator
MNPKNKKIFSNAGLTATMEDYLESIYILSKESEAVRVKDIANNLHVKMPTVTSMLKKLKEKGMINYERYEYIELTPKGSGCGKEINQRHQALSAFLTDILLIEPDRANNDACRMEHTISRTTLDRIVDFMGFVESCPRAGKDWLTCFNEFKKKRIREKRCLDQKDVHVFEHCPAIYDPGQSG